MSKICRIEYCGAAGLWSREDFPNEFWMRTLMNVAKVKSIGRIICRGNGTIAEVVRMCTSEAGYYNLDRVSKGDRGWYVEAGKREPNC
jgi:hypothetical protein